MNEAELIAFLKKNLKVVIKTKTHHDSIDVDVYLLLSEETIATYELDDNKDKIIDQTTGYIYL